MDKNNRDIGNGRVDGIANPDAHVGAPLRGRPIDPTNERGHPIDPTNDNRNIPPYGPDNKKYGATIGDAMNWFKTMTTNEYIRGVKTLGWPPFNKKLWQRNYYEHIIRNQQSYLRISEYIRNNPANWQDDKFYELWNKFRETEKMPKNRNSGHTKNPGEMTTRNGYVVSPMLRVVNNVVQLMVQ